MKKQDLRARIIGIEASHTALKLVVVMLIDQLAEGMSDRQRTAVIGRLFAGAHQAIDLALANAMADDWMLLLARREVTSISSRLLLAMGGEQG